MGGFGLVGATEAVVALGREDLVAPLRATLTPLSDRMLGHPWAPSFAAADLLCRLDKMAGDSKAATGHRDQACLLYERLGATTFGGPFDRRPRVAGKSLAGRPNHYLGGGGDDVQTPPSA